MPKKISPKNNFAYLTVALLLLLITSALVDQFAKGIGRELITAATLVSLAVGIWSIRSERHWFTSGLGFLGAVILVAIAMQLLQTVGLNYIYLIGILCYFLITAWLALKQVFAPGVVDANRIIGALCLFLLMGMIWAMFYLLMASLSVDSFRGIDTINWDDNFIDLIYYSFVTLTTLGYGDITPVLPLPRVFTLLEAIVGQFYLAVLVASLVGKGIAGKQHPEERA